MVENIQGSLKGKSFLIIQATVSFNKKTYVCCPSLFRCSGSNHFQKVSDDEGRTLTLVACGSICYMPSSNLSEDKDYHDQGFWLFS